LNPRLAGSTLRRSFSDGNTDAAGVLACTAAASGAGVAPE
jgi:hypothetical protein